ncbi:MAG: N-acetylmuramoyl-L-alanine amidase [Pseudomonadota bacterium]
MKRSTPTAALFALAVTTLASCSPYPVRDAPSANFNNRVRYLIIHYTSEDTATSLRLLTQVSSRPVSAHYLVDVPSRERGPATVYRLVQESDRAWHAGRSYWRGESSLNSASIGIEIVNQSACPALLNPLRAAVEAADGDDPSNAEAPNDVCSFLPYPEGQIETLIRLLQGILERHPDIEPYRVLAHSDIAPQRKTDPGPLFPWRRLHEAGIGAWYDEERVTSLRRRFATAPPSTLELQQALGKWGFDVSPTGVMDETTRTAVRAFQLHFRPARYDGEADAQTAAILYALNERYN